jgi:uncharacterized membrane protein YagU involved in acid resistance
MTLAMFEIQTRMPKKERSPLPPASLTDDAAKTFYRPKRAASREDLTMIAHFGYGAVCGAVYSALCSLGPSRTAGSALARGIGYGFGVWAFSYLGLIPAMGMRPQAKRMPLKRNAMMIAVHAVWGACLGLSEHRLQTRGRELLDGARKAPAAE